MMKCLIIISFIIVLIFSSCSIQTDTSPITSTPVTTSTPAVTQYVRNFVEGAQNRYKTDASSAEIGISPAQLQSLEVRSDTVINMNGMPYYYAVAAVDFHSYTPEVSINEYTIFFSDANPGVTSTGGGSSTQAKAEKDGKSVGQFNYYQVLYIVVSDSLYIQLHTIQDLTFLFMSYRTDAGSHDLLWLVMLPVPSTVTP